MWMLTEDWTQERPTRGWWCGAPTNEEPGEGVSHPELMGAEYTDTDVQREEGHQGFVQYTALDTEHYWCCLPPMACIKSVVRGKGPKPRSINKTNLKSEGSLINQDQNQNIATTALCVVRARGREGETLDTTQRERGSADRARAQPSPASLLGQGWVAHSAHWLWPLSLAAAPSYHWMEGGSRETLVITYRITTNNNHRQEDILSECDHLPVWEGSAWDAVRGLQAVNSDHLLWSGEKPGICGQ